LRTLEYSLGTNSRRYILFLMDIKGCPPSATEWDQKTLVGHVRNQMIEAVKGFNYWQ